MIRVLVSRRNTAHTGSWHRLAAWQEKNRLWKDHIQAFSRGLLGTYGENLKCPISLACKALPLDLTKKLTATPIYVLRVLSKWEVAIIPAVMEKPAYLCIHSKAHSFPSFPFTVIYLHAAPENESPPANAQSRGPIRWPYLPSALAVSKHSTQTPSHPESSQA